MPIIVDLHRGLMHPVLQQLADVVRTSNEVEWDQRSGGELRDDVLAVEQIEAELGALVLQLVGGFDASGGWAEDGCRSSLGWLAHHGRLARSTARRQLRHARALRAMPATRAALMSGEISLQHVAVLVHARSAERAAAFDHGEALLVEDARTLPFADFERAVQYWCQLADPDTAASDARQQIDSRRLHLSRTLDGIGVLDGTLDPLRYAIVAGELDRLEKQEFERDWAAARAEHGGAATAADLPRSPAQRRADALVRMAERSASTPAGARKPAPLVNLHLDWATFCAELAASAEGGQHTIGMGDGRAGSDQGSAGTVGAGGRRGPRLCELDDGTVLLPSQVLEQALRGAVRRVVFGPDGHILDFGRTKRLYDGGLRQAIQVRDRHCTAPGCDVPAKRCEIDHVVPWSRGGTTSEANGRLHCDHHNRSRQEGDP